MHTEIIFHDTSAVAFLGFSDAAVCVYISMLDWGLAGLPESKMKERETLLADKHTFVLISGFQARINIFEMYF